MVITNFAAGELSENLKGRVDISQYYAGAQKLKNFDIIPTGGIQRRVGMERMGKLNGECRLIPFIINKDLSFILEFVPGFIYFWKDGKKWEDGDGIQISIEIPYESLAEINEVQFAQNYDTMIFAQRNHKPFQLTYNFADRTFTGAEMTFNYFVDVMLDDDYGIVEIADTGLPPIKEGAYCIYNGQLWHCTDETEGWKVDGNDPEIDTGLFNEIGKYPGCVAFFQNRLWFASTEKWQQRIWASAAPDTKGPRYNKFGLYQKFVTVNKAVKDPDIHLFTATIQRGNIRDGKTILTDVSQNLLEDGVLEKAITDYFCTNATYVPIGTKVIDITSTTVTLDREITISEDVVHAVVFTISLWRSTESASADDYEYVVVNNNMTTSDVGFYLEPASDQNDAIKWLAPSNFLCAGTESNVWNIPSGANALNIAAVLNGRYGSDDIQAHVVDTAVIFFAQGKCGIREYYFNAANEAFQTNNIAILAEQILKESPAKDFDFCTNPYNRLIITRADGTAVTLLYDKNNGVMGWNRIEHGEGFLRSCAVTRGNGYSDLVYFSVYIDGEYYLERLDLSKEVYLDSWKKWDPEDDVSEYISDDAVLFNSGTGVEYYLKDLEEIPEDFFETVFETDAVYIGYRFESLILSMPVITNDISQKKRIVDLHVRFNNSYMPVMQTTGAPDEFFTGVEKPFSGVKKIEYPGQSDIDVTFKLAISEPRQCNILCVDASLS